MRVWVKANFQYDSDALHRFFEEEVAPLPIVWQGQGEYFGGWSVLSGNGKYTDGWVNGVGRDGLVDTGRFRQMFPVLPENMRVRTEICRGPVHEIVDRLDRLCAPTGILPARTRFTKLLAGRSLRWHSDSTDENWRLHLPVRTNEGCRFEWDLDGDGEPDDSLYMEPGSAYFVRVDLKHRFANRGNTDRVHLLMSLVSWRESFCDVFNEGDA